jgi:ribosomal protein S18 acetylase RimI-like enzyme
MRAEAFADAFIELAQGEDLHSILDLVDSVTRAMQSGGIDQWDEWYPIPSDIDSDLEDGNLYLCRYWNQIAGCVVLNSSQDPAYATVPWKYSRAPIGVVHRLMVAPTLHGRGIASFLMRFVEQRAREIGYKTIRLDAFSKNPSAVGLYDRLGYQRAGMVTFRKGIFHCFEKSLEQ